MIFSFQLYMRCPAYDQDAGRACISRKNMVLLYHSLAKIAITVHEKAADSKSAADDRSAALWEEVERYYLSCLQL